MFSYRSIFKKALEVVWENKYLWFFGFFASFLVGGGYLRMAFGRIDASFAQKSFFMGWSKLISSDLLGLGVLRDIGSAFEQAPAASFFALVFLLILFILTAFFIWLAVVSHIALINNSAKAIQKDKKSDVKEGIEAGMSNFWPVLGIVLASRLFCAFLAAFIGLPLIFIQYNSGLAFNTLYLLMFLVFLPVALAIGFIARYASAYVVIKGKKFIEALEKAWKLFIDNWLVSIEAAALIFIVNLGLSFLIVLFVLVLGVPYLAFAYAISLLLASVAAPFAIFAPAMSAGIVIATVLMVVLGSALTVFRISSWTGVFLKLDDKHPSLSKIMRIFG